MNPKLKTIGIYSGVALFCFCAATTVMHFAKGQPSVVVGPFGAGPTATAYDLGPLISAVVALLGTIAAAWAKKLAQPQKDLAAQVLDAIRNELPGLIDAVKDKGDPTKPADEEANVLAKILERLDALEKAKVSP